MKTTNSLSINSCSSPFLCLPYISNWWSEVTIDSWRWVEQECLIRFFNRVRFVVILDFWNFFEYLYSIEIRKASLNIFNRYCNYLFIKYELDEFELNGMNVYGWYDALSMFVNDMEWWSRHNIFRKGDIMLRLLGCALFGNLS